MDGAVQSRRRFLVVLPGVLVALSGRHSWAIAPDQGAQTKPHPEPRPGIDASRVMAAKDLGDDRKAIEAFDMVREIPQVIDGIRCSCGCDKVAGYYSLLSCFEQDGMASHCEICQDQARLIRKLHRQGKTLTQIRTTLDASAR